MSVLCVTGTSTDVGKTVVTAALAALAARDGIAVRVCKPIQTGVSAHGEGDLQRVTALTDGAPGIECARYPQPMAPQEAARRSGARLPSRAEMIDRIAGLDRPGVLTLIEGAGGLLVRLTSDDATVLDLARGLGAPFLVVTTADLGTLNHTELTTRAIAAAGLDCAGLVIGSWPAAPTDIEHANRRALPQITGVTMRGALPAGIAHHSPRQFLDAVTGRLDHTGVIEAVRNANGAAVG